MPDDLTAHVDGPGGGDDHRHSRRSFLRTGTLGVAAAGAFATVPGLSGFLTGASEDAPVTSGAAAEADAAAPEASGPILAHITDAAAGNLNIYVGDQEVAYHDPVLVQHLLRAAAG